MSSNVSLKLVALSTGLLALLSVWPQPAMANDPPQTDDDEDEEVHQVDQVVVTGSRTEHRLDDSPVATEVITREEIESSGAENVAEILEEHTGVEIVRSFRGAGIRLQGLDPEYVLILVDGERAIGRIGGAIDLARYSAEDIERIEIVRGPSSALYGSDAIGGVVNIITRESSRPYEAEIHSAYGSFNTLDLSGHGGLRTEDWNTRLSAGWHRSDGFDLNPSNIATTGSGFNEFNIENRTTYRPTKRIKLLGRTSYLRRNQTGIDESAAGAVFDRENLTETFSAVLGPEFRFDGPSKLRLTGHYSLFRDQFLQNQRGSTALD